MPAREYRGPAPETCAISSTTIRRPYRAPTTSIRSRPWGSSASSSARSCMFQSTSNGKKEVTGANVLVAIFGEKDSHAVYYLQQQGVTRLDVVNFISHGITKTGSAESTKSGEGTPESEEAAAQKGNAACTVHAEPEPDGARRQDRSADRREQEVERVVQVLCRRRKNNPLLVGEAGVGQDRDRRRPRLARHARRSARYPARCDGVLARHGGRYSPARNTVVTSNSA